MPWLPFAIQGGEALVVGLAAYFGAIPGVPGGNWQAALAFALAKLAPTGIVGKITGVGNAGQSKIA